MNGGDPPFAQRIAQVSESHTTRIFTRAQQMRARGRDIISLAVGEPDFDTPAPILHATARALADGRTRYGPVAGEPGLRERLAAGFEGFSADRILVTNGAKQALFSLFQVLCDSGDEVILPRPCWVSFTEQIQLAGARPVLVDTDAGFQLDPDRIAKAVTPRTRAILINSPNNPTGAVYGADALAAVAAIAAEQRVWLIADEAYHVFTYGDRPHVPVLGLSPAPDGVITVRSFSKQFNMTGFRIGYVAAAPSVIQALTRLQSHTTGNVCTFAQYGALAALEMDPALIDRRRVALRRRRDLALGLARALFTCAGAQGAFYIFADVSAHLRAGQSSADLALRLLDAAGVAVVPGEAFHGPGHIRISYGCDSATLGRAFARIKEGIKEGL
ncbi:pyridoxal phosphate-dependent aminotransferase [Desulfatitalea alkaliphila]|uniref:Aminotransferase n=1 Tax=Desulfatitalea alkaliphila TaxID=2929485 RepID=A0AA41UIU8_9BACT|nr:pyridoxal phosphate-dependent aminotransferase [Desulfatitalea alkaliphila]MCJ8500489.1 pyridoxal phosphate-dependent aminotransferase [Desulfatitalea alkaliphila]